MKGFSKGFAKNEQKVFYVLKVYSKDIPRLISALEKQKDVYSSILLENIRGDCKHQGWCEDADGKHND